MGIEKQKLKTFAVVEMMGHRRVVGLVTESDISGGQLLRVDVIDADGEPEHTEYVGVGSIYCLTVVTEQVAKAVVANGVPRPAWAYGAASAAPPGPTVPHPPPHSFNPVHTSKETNIDDNPSFITHPR